MKAIRLLVLTALFVVLTSALSGTANAQYLILSSSNVFDPATGEVVAFSRTEMDYWAAGYYNAYVKGDIYSGSNTAPSATGENYSNGNFAAAVTTRHAAAPNTSYQLWSYHYVLPLSLYSCGPYYRWDTYCFWSGSYPQGNHGESVTIYPGFNGCNGCYSGWIYLGSTNKGVVTPAFSLTMTNPRVGGNLNGTLQKALPGGDIQLKANANYPGGTYSWTFTGPSSVTSGATNSSSITIRPTNPGTITAKVTYTRSGVPSSAAVTINSILPTLAYAAEQTTDIYGRNLDFCGLTDPGISYWTLGCSSGDPGIGFSATAEIPAGTYLNDTSKSGIKYVQAVSAMRKIRFQNGNIMCTTGRSVEDNVDSGWRLDDAGPNGDPYDPAAVGYFSQPSVNIATSDSPMQGWDSNTIDAIRIDDRFQMYVVYFVGSDPRAPQYQYRLGSLSWNWRGQLVYNIGGYDPSVSWKIPYRQTADYGIEGVHPRDPVTSTVVYQGRNSSLSYVTCPWGPPPITTKIDGSRFFVNQHYVDFLNRQADQSGSDYWTSHITPCGFDQNCISRQRVIVSKAFFTAPEFTSQHPEITAPTGTHEYNWWFVYWCYRGYLRREPNAPPDNNRDGLNYWVGVMDSSNPDAGEAKYGHIIQAFIESNEYRYRPEFLSP